MADATTKLVIEAQTKGLAEATQAAKKLEDSLGGVSKGAGKSTGGLKSVLKTLRAELKASIKDSDALGAAYDKQNKQLKALQREYDLLAKSIKGATRASAEGKEEAGRAPPAPPTFFARLRSRFGGGGSGGGTGSGDGTGSPGGPRGAFGQGFLQGVLPEAFIQRGPGALTQAAGAMTGRLARGVAGAGLDLATSPLSGSQAAVSALSRIPFAGALASGLQMSLAAAATEAGTQKQFQSLMPFLRSSGSPGALATLNGLRTSAGGLGMTFGGMSGTESAALVGQMAAAGGGIGSQYSGRTLREAFAAQAGLGVDAGTSGVLARGDALGATTGRGSSTLAKAIADAVSLGLQGSEITRYVQNIAGSVESFAQTGIKVDESSRGGIGRLLEASGGYSAPRAAALASGVASTASQVADQGPQNPYQMMLLQQAGFDPSDPDSFYRAQERIDNASPGDLAKMVAGARGQALSGMRGLSTYGRAAAYRRFGEGIGMNLRIGEARRDSSTSLSAADIQTALQPPDAAAAMRQTETSGQFNTTAAAQALGTMANLDTATGLKMAPGMLQMDQTARKTLNSLSTAGSKFIDLAAKIQTFGSELINLGGTTLGVATPMTPQ